MNKLSRALLFGLATAGTLLILTYAGADSSPLPLPSPSASPMVTQMMTAVPEVAAPPEWVGAVLVQMQSLPYVGPVIAFVLKWTGILAVIFTSFAVFLIGIAKGLDKVSEWSPYLQWMSKLADKINLITPWLKWASMLNQPKPWKPDASGTTSKT